MSGVEAAVVGSEAEVRLVFLGEPVGLAAVTGKKYNRSKHVPSECRLSCMPNRSYRAIHRWLEGIRLLQFTGIDVGFAGVAGTVDEEVGLGFDDRSRQLLDIIEITA